jgi:stage V sporulation protein AC
MRNIDEKKYEQYVKQLTPTHSLPLNMAKAFLTGGLICLLGQVIINTALALGADTSDARTWCSVLLILLSVILTGFGIYPKIGKFGGAGSLVPITGFANAVVSPALEFQHEGFVLGTAAQMFSIAGPVLVYGVTTSVLYGLILFVFHLY